MNLPASTPCILFDHDRLDNVRNHASGDGRLMKALGVEGAKHDRATITNSHFHRAVARRASDFVSRRGSRPWQRVHQRPSRQLHPLTPIPIQIYRASDSTRTGNWFHDNVDHRHVLRRSPAQHDDDDDVFDCTNGYPSIDLRRRSGPNSNITTMSSA